MRYLIVVLVSLCLWNCQEVKRPEMPLNLIPEDRMVDILTEVYLINAGRSFDNKTIIENKMKLDSFFYKKFNIDSIQFAASNAYYTSNLNTYTNLFLKVEEKMTFLKKESDSLLLIRIKEQEAKRIQDSINGIIDTINTVNKDTIIAEMQLIEPEETK